MIPFVVVSFLVIFALVLLSASLGFRFLEGARKKRVSSMLETAAGQAEPEPVVLFRRDQGLGGAARLLSSLDLGRHLTRQLQQAGMTQTAGQLVGLMAAAGVLGGLIGWRTNLLLVREVSIPALAVLFALAPYLWVSWKRSQRMGQFEEQFPEALDFLSRSMRAGHAFSVALEMLAEEFPEPLGLEFRKVFNEQNLGAPLEVALGNLAVRMPLVDVRFFVSSVLLQRETGGNLSEILNKLSYIIRERFQLKGQVKAASAHGRITALILTLLPLVTMVALLVVAPGYLQTMAKDEHGKWLIVGSIFGQLLGYLTMRKIVNIKV